MSYATPADLDARALPPDVRSGASSAEKQAALDGANGVVNGYLAQAGYAVPVATPGDDVIEAEVAVAAWRLAMTLGLAPEQGERSNLYLRNRDAMKWLEAVAGGRVQPSGAEQATGTGATGSPIARSEGKRGW